ncbi:MAG: hypothetical protein HOP12_15300 [Candidatus Eisenbacteria bacterium]|uniref:Uncharacterized protein n=1 Tax=Eiseniibacteriota bacterium TaxID=2212470 RepID=A0A849SM46_UNCEI|nr:hypothetical protein [Candidatus Eisenbacteria bacterium]
MDPELTETLRVGMERRAEFLLASSLDDVASKSQIFPPHFVFLDVLSNAGTAARRLTIETLVAEQRWNGKREGGRENPSLAPRIVLMTQASMPGEEDHAAIDLREYSDWDSITVDLSNPEGLAQSVLLALEQRLPRLKRNWQLPIQADDLPPGWRLPELDDATQSSPQGGLATYLASDVVIQQFWDGRRRNRDNRAAALISHPVAGHSRSGKLFVNLQEPSSGRSASQFFLKLRPRSNATSELLAERNASRDPHWKRFVLVPKQRAGNRTAVGDCYVGSFTALTSRTTLSRALLSCPAKSLDGLRATIHSLLRALDTPIATAKGRSMLKYLSDPDKRIENSLSRLGSTPGWRYEAPNLFQRRSTFRVGPITGRELTKARIIAPGPNYEHLAHGDLHADNVLVDIDAGQVRVIDCTEMQRTDHLFSDFVRLELSLFELFLDRAEDDSRIDAKAPPQRLFNRVELKDDEASPFSKRLPGLWLALRLSRQSAATKRNLDPGLQYLVPWMYFADLWCETIRLLNYLIEDELAAQRETPSTRLLYMLRFAQKARIRALDIPISFK